VFSFLSLKYYEKLGFYEFSYKFSFSELLAFHKLHEKFIVYLFEFLVFHVEKAVKKLK